jgi:catechol 2,3-dioxygenase-like lactoylglutathione lyase family enzyme
MKGQFYHVVINVSDFGKSVKFYEGFLVWLGYQRIYSHKIAAGWGLKGATPGCNFWIIQCDTGFAKHGYHRKRVGVNHIAFHADSRKAFLHNRILTRLLQPAPHLTAWGSAPGKPSLQPLYSMTYSSVNVGNRFSPFRTQILG